MSNKEINAIRTGLILSIPSLVTLVLVALKIYGIFTVSWWIVLAPIWLMWFCIILMVVFIDALCSGRKDWMES